MTKLTKVLKFCNNKRVFTWEQFMKANKCSYPCTETNYLSMLVNAQYVQKMARGKYQVNIVPPVELNHTQLKWEAYRPSRRREIKVEIKPTKTKLKFSKTIYVQTGEYDQDSYGNCRLTINSKTDKIVFDETTEEDFKNLQEIYSGNIQLKITIEEV